MPHFPKPFLRKDRGLWYVQLHGQQHNLGSDRDKAFTKYHELMNRPVPVHSELVLGIVEGFLDWCQKHRAPLTYVWYKERLESFCRSLANPTSLTVSELKPFHVQLWADSFPDWGDSQKRGAISAVQRALRWAEKLGHIDRSPIRFIEKPEQSRREKVITTDEYRTILDRYTDEEFRDVLEFSWETGARPQETVRVEASFVNLQRGRIEIPPKEAKGKKRWRIIYLTTRAEEIVRRLMLKRPDGKLFRTTDGSPWKAGAINCRFNRLQVWIGRGIMEQQGVVIDEEAVKELAGHLPRERTIKGKRVAKTEKDLMREARKKLMTKMASKFGSKYCLYNFRHTFANRLLEAGCDALTVSALLGHADGTMLAKVYSHLGKSNDYLRDELMRATG